MIVQSKFAQVVSVAYSPSAAETSPEDMLPDLYLPSHFLVTLSIVSSHVSRATINLGAPRMCVRGRPQKDDDGLPRLFQEEAPAPSGLVERRLYVFEFVRKNFEKKAPGASHLDSRGELSP